MRILLVSEPGENGVFRHVEDLTEYLISAGHIVSLAYSDVRGSDRLFCLVDKVRQAGGLTENLEIANQPQLGDLRAIVRLLGLYHRFKPQVVHAHSAKAGGLVRILRRFGASPQVFYTPHAYYGLGRPPSFSVRFFTFVERYLAPRTVTINLSPDEAEYGKNVLRLPLSLQKLIPNGVNTRHFTSGTASERQALRTEMGIPQNAVVVGSLGRFSFQKDPMTLHRAFRACVDLMPDLYLVHVGSGDLRSEVQKYARNHGYEHRVIWIDYLRDPGPFYRMLDCFMLTSRYEGLSFAVLEAMASNVPLVLSDAPGNRGFTELGLSHLWTARVEYPASFASAITSWYDDRAHPRPCNHQEIANSAFSRKVQFENIEAAYAQAIGPRIGNTEQSAHPARS